MKRLANQRGFLLLEVILAVVLLAIGLFVVIEGLGRCLAAARSIQQYSVSQTLLANKVTEFRVERPSDYMNQEGRFDDYPGYRWERRFDLTDTEKLWLQTITVSWEERGRTMTESVYEYRYIPDKQQ